MIKAVISGVVLAGVALFVAAAVTPAAPRDGGARVIVRDTTGARAL